MQYLVHIENCTYFQWQIQLLLESFRKLGLEDQLFIAYSGDPIQFPNAFEVENVGEKWGCPCMTKFFSAFAAQKAGRVKQPFVLIDPDMFIVKEVKPVSSPLASNYFSYMEKSHLEIMEGYGKLPADGWCPAGVVYHFSEVPIDVFEDTVNCCHFVANKFKEGDRKLSPGAYWFRDMVGVALGLSRSGLQCEMVNYQSALDHRREDFDLDANFVHYCKSYPPYFFKTLYDDRKWFFRDKTPFQDILNIPDHRENPHVAKFKLLVQSFAEQNQNYFTS